MKDKKYRKVRYHFHFAGGYRDVEHSICNIKYSVPKKVPITLIMDLVMINIVLKELAEEFKKQIPSLGENTEKYITFTVPIGKTCKN